MKITFPLRVDCHKKDCFDVLFISNMYGNVLLLPKVCHFLLRNNDKLKNEQTCMCTLSLLILVENESEEFVQNLQKQRK